MIAASLDSIRFDSTGWWRAIFKIRSQDSGIEQAGWWQARTTDIAAAVDIYFARLFGFDGLELLPDATTTILTRVNRERQGLICTRPKNSLIDFQLRGEEGEKRER